MASKQKGFEKQSQHIALDANMQKEFEEKVKTIKPKSDTFEPGVLYVGHIPHGFYEPQMKKFFSQFGTVTRLRLSRSRKSGRCKGYGFVEFEYSEVARIVAETMNNYLTYNKLLKCQLMPKEKVHTDLFKGSDRRFYNPSFVREKAIKQHNSILTASEDRIHKIIKKRVRKSTARKNKIAKAGIDYEFDGCCTQWEKLKESGALVAAKKQRASDIQIQNSKKKQRTETVNEFLSSGPHTPDAEISFKTNKGLVEKPIKKLNETSPSIHATKRSIKKASLKLAKKMTVNYSRKRTNSAKTLKRC